MGVVMSHRTAVEVDASGMLEGSRDLRRVYMAPFAERLHVGRTAGGEPDFVPEARPPVQGDDYGPLGSS